VKAVELRRGKAGIELANYGVETLAPDTVVDGAIMDAISVAGAIEKIFGEQRIKTKNVATAVSGHSVIVKRITLPFMSEEELYDRIQTEASQHVPFDISDVNLDYNVLEQGTEAQMDVLLVAVKKEKILNHTNVLSQAGKIPTIVDIDAFALQNCFEANYEPGPEQTVALLNIGASVMNINIVRNGVPLFTRDVSVGGNQYTDALQKELDLSYDDAEGLKQGRTVAGVTEEHRTAVLNSVSDILLLETQKTFDFFRATATGEAIQRIYVAGGSARIPGLLELLKEEFNVPVEELFAFRKIIYDPVRHAEERIRELAPRLAVAVGLALRSFDGL
jgi:type IV pilus assembly protein PilM